jgi:hypothetical protein
VVVRVRVPKVFAPLLPPPKPTALQKAMWQSPVRPPPPPPPPPPPAKPPTLKLLELLPKVVITSTEAAAAVDSPDSSTPSTSKVTRKVRIQVSLPDYLQSPKQRASGTRQQAGNGTDVDDELAPSPPPQSSPPAATTTSTSSIKTIAPNWMVNRENRIDQSSVTVATKPVSSASPRGKWVPPKRPPGVVATTAAAAAAQPDRKKNVTYISEPASSDDRLGINQLVPLLFTVLVLLSLMYAKS